MHSITCNPAFTLPYVTSKHIRHIEMSQFVSIDSTTYFNEKIHRIELQFLMHASIIFCIAAEVLHTIILLNIHIINKSNSNCHVHDSSLFW